MLNSDDKKDKDFEYVTTWRGAFAINSQYGFTPNMGVGLSVFYSFHGQHYKLSGVERFKRVEYLKFPVLFIYNIDLSEHLMAIYKIGPQIGILTHARVTDKEGTDIVSDQKDAYANTIFGAMGSVGLGLKLLDRLYFDLTIRGDYDFTNAENENYTGNVNMPEKGMSEPPFHTDRAMTNNMTLGANIGVRYLLCKQK